jgi:hypothetical protein
MIKAAPKSKKVARKRKKSSSWKTVSKKRKQQAKFKSTILRYISVFAFFSVSILFLIGYVSYKKLTSPFVSASSYSSVDIQNADIFTMSLVFVDDHNKNPILVDKAYYMIFDTKGGKILTYEIPSDMTFDVPGKYSYEEFSKILGLGMSLNNNDFESGIEITNQTLSNYFGLSTDKFIVVDASMSSTFEDLLVNRNSLFVPNIAFLEELGTAMKTNMSVSEMYFTYKFIGNISDGAVVKVTLGDSKSSDAYTDLIDAKIRDMTLDSEVSSEEKSISVLNGTKTPGLATFGSRVVSNMGGRVIAVSNASSTYETSFLVVDDVNSATTKEIARFFKIDNVLVKDEAVTFDEFEIARSDVVLIIGVDIDKAL